MTAALSFHEFSRPKRKELIKALGKLCARTVKLAVSESYHRDRTYQLQDGLRKVAALALVSGLDAEALAMARRAPHQRPRIWSFSDAFYHDDVFPFVFRTALVAAVKKVTLHEKDLLPQELVPVCFQISKTMTGKAFRDKAKVPLSSYLGNQREGDKKAKRSGTLSYDERQHAERFIDWRLEPLLKLTKTLSAVLAAPSRSVDKAFIELLVAWEDACKNRDPYRTGEINHFFRRLGLDMRAVRFLARDELKPASVERFLTAVHGQHIGAHTISYKSSRMQEKTDLARSIWRTGTQDKQTN